MKIFFRCFFFLFLLMFSFSWTFAYELTENDYKLVDRVEEKLYEKIDTTDNFQPETLISLLENVIEKKQLGGKIKAILQTIIEDLKIDYSWESLDDEFFDADYEMAPEDCFEDELYDAEEKYCYVELEGDWDYNDEDFWDEYIDESFYGSEVWDFDFDYNYNDDDFWDNYDEDQYEDGSEGEEEWVVYKINGDVITLTSWNADKKYNEIWKLFTTLIPKNYRTDFTNYSVTNNPDGDTFAHVAQNNEDNKKWDIGVNMGAFYQENGELNKKESVHTLIHEFAHVLTLGKTQMQYVPTNLDSELMMNRFKNKCRTNMVMEGCLYKDYYLDQLINKFWKEDFKKMQAAEEDEQLDFYTGKEKNFVTDYASTNPGEGIAETFTFFVLKTIPTGSTVADQKINFFYSFPELVKLRQVIRTRLDTIK